MTKVVLLVFLYVGIFAFGEIYFYDYITVIGAVLGVSLLGLVFLFHLLDKKNAFLKAKRHDKEG